MNLAAAPTLVASLSIVLVALLLAFFVLRRKARQKAWLEVPLSLRELTPDEFERRLGRAMQREGYSVVGTDRESMTLRRSGEITLIWFSGWRDVPLSTGRIRRLQALLVERGAAACKVLTVFKQSEDLRRQLTGKVISVLQASEIAKLMAIDDAQRLDTTFNTSFVPDSDAQDHVAAPGEIPQPPIAGATSLAPACPRCKSPMTLHTAASGGALGQHFWQCSRAPDCRGIRTAD